MITKSDIVKLLPGFNCGICGYANCESFAAAILKKEALPDKCKILEQERFKEKRLKLENIDIDLREREECRGLIDHCAADFTLYPLPGEVSCRETLISFSHIKLKENMLIRYRPLGCPIIHFARIIEINHGLPDIWVIGPNRSENNISGFTDIGVCMILSFRGVIDGKMPETGQTVKFLPGHCMMGKVHSGVIVNLEGKKARIDCIDLKIWEHAK